MVALINLKFLHKGRFPISTDLCRKMHHQTLFSKYEYVATNHRFLAYPQTKVQFKKIKIITDSTPSPQNKNNNEISKFENVPI